MTIDLTTALVDLVFEFIYTSNLEDFFSPEMREYIEKNILQVAELLYANNFVDETDVENIHAELVNFSKCSGISVEKTYNASSPDFFKFLYHLINGTATLMKHKGEYGEEITERDAFKIFNELEVQFVIERTSKYYLLNHHEMISKITDEDIRELYKSFNHLVAAMMEVGYSDLMRAYGSCAMTEDMPWTSPIIDENFKVVEEAAKKALMRIRKQEKRNGGK